MIGKIESGIVAVTTVIIFIMGVTFMVNLTKAEKKCSMSCMDLEWPRGYLQHGSCYCKTNLKVKKLYELD